MQISDMEVLFAEKSITINHDGEAAFTLTRDLAEGRLTALLRVNGKLAFYRINVLEDLTASEVELMIRMAVTQFDGALFYLSGTCAVKTKRPKGKPACRAVYVGSTQIAVRNGRLILPQIYVRDLGTVSLDDTGDTTYVYQQLNNLI